MPQGSGPEGLRLSEDENTNIEEFNEAVSSAGRQAGGAVVKATQKDGGKTAKSFSDLGSSIVQGLQSSGGINQTGDKE